MSRVLFPACASFGPMCLAMGCLFPNREGLPYGFVFLAFPGALMTVAALHILFRMLLSLERMPSVTDPSTEFKARE